MPNSILWDSDKLSSVAAEIAGIESGYDQMAGEIRGVLDGLDWKVAISSSVDEEVKALSNEVKKEADTLFSLRSVVGQASGKVTDTTTTIKKSAQAVDGSDLDTIGNSVPFTLFPSTGISFTSLLKPFTTALTVADWVGDKVGDVIEGTKDWFTNLFKGDEVHTSTVTNQLLEMDSNPRYITKDELMENSHVTVSQDPDAGADILHIKQDNSAKWGGYSSSSGCAVASVAIALSSLGIHKDPIDIINSNGGSVYTYWGRVDSANLNVKITGSSGANVASLDEALYNYVSQPDVYAPPIIGSSAPSQHYITVIGKNADGSYNVVDSGYNITRYVRATEGYGRSNGTVTANLTQIVQYSKK